MKRIGYMLGMALSLVAPRWAAAVTFEASVDRNVISLADRLTYSLVVSGAENASPQPPEVKGMEVVGRSSSTQFSMSNGRTDITLRTDYILVPLKAGQVTIPSAVLRYQGHTYTTRPITVKVVDAGSSLPPPAVREPSGKEARTPSSEEKGPSRLFVRSVADPKEVFINQQVTLDFQIFSALEIGDLDYTPAPAVGFVEMDMGNPETGSAVRDGLRYRVTEIHKAVFPISAGDLTVSPAELRGNIYLPRSRRQDPFFEGFFPDPFNYERRPFVLRSDPVSIRVLPLPSGAPASFTGGVGNFDLEVEVAPRRVGVGEPFTVTVSVRGIGNLDSVGMPVIDLGGKFRTYDPEIETKPEVVGGRIGGTKIFRMAVVPLEAGDLRLPDVVLSFFNPSRKNYEETRAACGTVAAAPAPEGERARLVSAPAAPSNREIELLGKDILYIKTDPGEWVRAGESGRFAPAFWWLQALPAAVVLLAWRVAARRERLRSDKVYARKVGASRSARKRFARARRLLEAGESREFYAEVHRAFARYLGDRLGIPSAAVDASGVRGRLEGLELPPGTLAHVQECFDTCDRVRYAPGGGDRAEMERFLSLAQELVAKMEKIRL